MPTLVIRNNVDTNGGTNIGNILSITTLLARILTHNSKISILRRVASRRVRSLCWQWLHEWGGGLGGTRSRIMPHIKTYVDYELESSNNGHSNGGVKINTFLLTSHNMSDAAWGTWQHRVPTLVKLSYLPTSKYTKRVPTLVHSVTNCCYHLRLVLSRSCVALSRQRIDRRWLRT